MPAHLLRVSVRRTRLALLAALSLLAVAALTLLFCRGGVQVAAFVRGELSAADQEALLDRYNSYSGSVAAAVERPLEIFVALAVQVVVLRFLADEALRVRPSPALRLVAMGLSAGVGYLLANGLNALNFQVRETPVVAVVSSSDVALQLQQANSSTVATSFSELAPRNPVMNSIFRNVLLPRAERTPYECRENGVVDEDSIDFGVSQHEWMKRLVPEAVTTRSLKIMVDSTANQQLRVDDLPMNASVAADLVITAVMFGKDYLPWGKTGSWYHADVAQKHFPTNEKNFSRVEAAAKVAGLLPPQSNTTEREDRQWFLDHSAAYVATAVANFSHNMSSDAWRMEFSRVDLAPSVWAESVTFERYVGSSFLTTATNKQTKERYYVGSGLTGTSTRHLIVKRDGSEQRVRIHAFAACENADGTATLRSNLFYRHPLADYNISCDAKSNTSLLVVSTGSRLVADALVMNATADKNGIHESEGAGPVAVNLRRIYSVTFSRISWRLEELAEWYGASCAIAGGCMGLRTELEGAKQHLIVGAGALPLRQVAPVNYQSWFSGYDQRPRQILRVIPPQESNNYDYDRIAGDILLPHNVRQIVGNATVTDDCDAANEERIQLVVNNHMYIENTLQTAYMGGMFFLFQNAIARDVIHQEATNSVTLAFDRNTQLMSVRLSIPWLNVALTLAGCVLLLGLLLTVLLWSYFVPADIVDPLVRITTPHVIARVMVDEATFPTLLLQREVIESEQGDTSLPAEEFFIQSLTLEPLKSDADDKEAIA